MVFSHSAGNGPRNTQLQSFLLSSIKYIIALSYECAALLKLNTLLGNVFSQV